MTPNFNGFRNREPLENLHGLIQLCVQRFEKTEVLIIKVIFFNIDSLTYILV